MSWDAWATDQKPEAEVSWGDHAKNVAAGVADVGSSLASLAQHYYDSGKDADPSLSGVIREAFGKASNDLTQSMSPEARDRLAATMTSEAFWQHPASAASLKIGRMVPMVAAAAIPGGIFADASMAAAATAVAGGALNAGGVVDEVYKKVEEKSDEQLQKESTLYAGLRSTFSEKEARRQYMETMLGLKPALNFALGAVVGAVGPAASIVKGLKGAGPGVIAGTAEGAASNALQGGVANYSTQQAELEGGLKKDFDQQALVDAVLEGGVLGGVGGAVGGAIGKLGKGREKAQEIKAKNAPEPEVDLNEQTAQPAKQSGTGTPIAPVEAPVGDAQNQPTRSSVDYPKAEAAKTKGKSKGKVKGPTVETVEPGAPTTAEAAAIADLQQPRAPEAPVEVPAPVAEAAQRVARPAQPEQPAPQPAVPALGVSAEPAVPPEVAAASQRVNPQVTSEVTPTPQTPDVRAEVPAPASTAPVQAEIVPEPTKIAAAPEPVKPTVATETKPPDAAAPVKRTGRVLENVSPEAKAAKKATNQKLKENLKAASAEEKEQGTKNYTETEKSAIADRAQHAEELYNEHAKPHSMPVTVAERKAMYEQLGKILEAAAERGLVPRETLAKDVAKNSEQFHLSIPQKVGDAGMSPHVRYLRELIGVRKALSDTRFGPASKARARVRDFVNESNDLEALAERRKLRGDEAKRIDQGEVGEPTGETAEKTAVGDTARTDTMSPEDRLIAAEEQSEFDGEEVEQGKSVKHIEVKPEKAKADVAARAVPDKVKVLSPREARKQAIAATKKPAEKINAIKSHAKKPEAIQSALRTEVPNKFRPDRTVESLKSMPAREALQSLDLTHLAGVPKALARIAQKRFETLVGDVDVHIVTNRQMAEATGDVGTAFVEDAMGGTRGLATMKMENGKTIVLLRADQFETPQATAHAVLHEVAHAATMRALVEDKKLYNTVSRMMAETEAFLENTPDIRKKLSYALSDEREYIAEAFSNPEVQEVLASIPMSNALARELGLARRSTAWDLIVETVRRAIEKATGRIPDGARMIEGVMRLGPEFEAHLNRNKTRRMLGQDNPVRPHDAFDQSQVTAKLDGERVKRELEDAKTNAGQGLRRVKDRLSTTFMMKARENDTFGPSRPLNRIFDLRARQEREKDAILEKHGGAELVRRAADLERAHPEVMAKAEELIFDASNYNVNLGASADNSHLGKDATAGWQAKAVLPELQKRFAEIEREAPDVAKYLEDSVKFFREIHNEVSLTTIRNILDVANYRVPGLAERIFRDGLTEDDRKTHNSEIIKALDRAASLKELKGWYVPFRRYGDFISSGHHEIAVPEGATKIGDDTVQFVDTNKGGITAARRLAENFARQSSHTSEGNRLRVAEVREVYIDKADPAKLLEKEDVDSVPAYRVKLQTQHTEFHDTLAEAERNATALKEAGLINTVTHKREDAHAGAPGIEGALSTVIRSLEHNESFKALDSEQRQAVKQSLMDASVRAMSSTNIKTSMAKRRNVAGMSKDLGRVTADYARMTANYLAQLKFRPEIDKVFAEMRNYIKDHKYDGKNLRREEVYQEFSKRIYGADAAAADRVTNAPTRRLLQVSRLARLGGVSFHLVNAQEPFTTALPVIAGRHGVARTTRALVDSYGLIGAKSAIWNGLSDTARAFTRDGGFADYPKLFKAAIGKSKALGEAKASRLQDLVDYLQERNLYGNDALFEVGKHANPGSNILGRALDRADLMANQVGSALESINRTVSALTAYDLEYKKNGGNHEAAKHYAYTVAHEVNGDYSSWNSAPVFNSQLGKLTLQFRRFGQKMYYLLGKTAQNALAGDREAQKQFAGLMVTHAMVAGALGLPWEIPKVALMSANLLGATSFTPEDFDDAVRGLAARVFGQKGGEIVSKGLWRGIGVEASGRMGLDSLLTYGSPKTQKANDIKAFLWDTMAGAPAGYLLDQVAAAQALMKGDVSTAIEKASPIRAISDVTKAVGGSLGPKTAADGKETAPALTPYQAGIRALGFTPAAVAENSAQRRSVANAEKKQSGERTSLVNAWVTAKPSEKSNAWRTIQRWNASAPKDTRITMDDLTRAKSRTDKANAAEGLQPNKRNKEIVARANSIYNP